MTEEYTPKNILLTGGAGFIGSHVVIRLVETYPNANIINLDKLDYCSSLKNLASIANAPNYKFIKGDILSMDLVAYVMEKECIDTILHFAAQTHVDNSFGNSMCFTTANVMGTHNLLECCRIHPVKRFIHVSTDEVYGEIVADDDRATEMRVLEPTNPYAATKAAAEFLVKSYHHSFHIPIIITRGNNVYGPHQYPEKLIPKLICRLDRGMKCTIHGDGSHRRSFLFARDVAAAFELVLRKGQVGQIYNIGTDFEMSNLQVAKKLISLFGMGGQEDDYLEFVEDRKFNDFRYAIDSTKLRDLGWEPVVSFEDGLWECIEWYRKYANNWDNVEVALSAHPTFGHRTLG